MESVFRTIALSDIGDAVGTPPSSRFRKSVRRMGVIQPVLLAEKISDSGELQFVIIDGNRRVAAARSAKAKHIPAVVLGGLTADQIAQLTLVANGFRSANYLTEFWAIRTLVRNQFSYAEIADIGGLTENSIGTRESLGMLNRELFVALRNGKLPQAYALTISRLGRGYQESLAQRFRINHRLLKKDIDEFVTAARQADYVTTPRLAPNAAEPAPSYAVTFISPGSLPAVSDNPSCSPERAITQADPGGQDAFVHASLEYEENRTGVIEGLSRPSTDPVVSGIGSKTFVDTQGPDTSVCHEATQGEGVSASDRQPQIKSANTSWPTHLSSQPPASLMSILTGQLLQAIETSQALNMDKDEFITYAG